MPRVIAITLDTVRPFRYLRREKRYRCVADGLIPAACSPTQCLLSRSRRSCRFSQPSWQSSFYCYLRELACRRRSITHAILACPSALAVCAFCSVSCPSLHTQIAFCSRPCQNHIVFKLPLSSARCVRSAIRRVRHVVTSLPVRQLFVRPSRRCGVSPQPGQLPAAHYRRAGTTVAPSVVTCQYPLSAAVSSLSGRTQLISFVYVLPLPDVVL